MEILEIAACFLIENIRLIFNAVLFLIGISIIGLSLYFKSNEIVLFMGPILSVPFILPPIYYAIDSWAERSAEKYLDEQNASKTV